MTESSGDAELRSDIKLLQASVTRGRMLRYSLFDASFTADLLLSMMIRCFSTKTSFLESYLDVEMQANLVDVTSMSRLRCRKMVVILGLSYNFGSNNTYKKKSLPM